MFREENDGRTISVTPRAPLVDDFGGWTVGLLMAVFVAVSVICTWALPETKGTSLREDAARAAC